MAVSIKDGQRSYGIPDKLLRMLPYRLADEIRQRSDGIRGAVEEIRLRTGRAASLTVDGRNIVLRTVLLREEVERFFSDICEGSLYAHSETINNGYITLGGGIRVGICGRASTSGGRILGIYDVSAINVRIPREVRRIGEPVCRLLRERRDRGVLVFSPPGVGKTTLLRSVCESMASGGEPWRVAVIDTRGELFFSPSGEAPCLDVLSGYPRGIGIEIATRTMNAQLIACDEIGDTAEAEAIIAAQNCGVPFLATAHAESVPELLCRTGIAKLHTAHVFGYYVGISRRGAELNYTLTKWEDAWGDVQSCGGAHNTPLRRTAFGEDMRGIIE